jgi:hypothetical protein
MTRYFFLAEGWSVGRVWEFGGLWNEATWRRKPKIQRLNLGLIEQGQTLWLYEAEEAVLMLEVCPELSHPTTTTIGQVMLKRLMDSDQVIHRLASAEGVLRA